MYVILIGLQFEQKAWNVVLGTRISQSAVRIEAEN